MTQSSEILEAQSETMTKLNDPTFSFVSEPSLAVPMACCVLLCCANIVKVSPCGIWFLVPGSWFLLDNITVTHTCEDCCVAACSGRVFFMQWEDPSLAMGGSLSYNRTIFVRGSMSCSGRAFF